MRRAIGTLVLAQALALAITTAVGTSVVFAQNANDDEPTAQDLKNSKERNVILLPSEGSIQSSSAKPSAKTVVKSQTPAAKTASSPKASSTGKTAQGKQTQATKKNVAASASSQSIKTNSPIVQASSSDRNSIINVWLDKKGSSPQYRSGDKMKINVSASQDCNVMIFDYDGKGKLTQLYPNEYQQKTLLRAGDTITFGGSDSPFDYQVSLPKGSKQAQEHIFVYAYPVAEKPLSIALNPSDGSPFRSGEMTLAQYKKMVAESKVFFNGSEPAPSASGERDVKIVPKTPSGGSQLKLVSNEENAPSGQPNKRELSFTILGN